MGVREVTINLTYGAHRNATVTFEAEEGEEITLSEAIAELSRSYGVPTDGRVLVNGAPANPSTPVKDKDSIEVEKATGTKG